MFCTVGQPPGHLFYELHGATGDADHNVLLIMGSNTLGAFWRPTVAALTMHPGLRVCTFDHRGVGQSSPDAGGCTIASLTRDTHDLLRHLGWTRAHVVGISMGGMIAQRLALQDPQAIRSLALLSTTARVQRNWLNIFRILRRYRFTGPFPARNAHNWLVELHPWSWLQAPRDPGGTNYDHLLRRYTTELPAPRDRLAHPHARAARDHRLSDAEAASLAALAVPILLLHGEVDRLLAVEQGRRLAEQIGRELTVVAGGGHFLIDQFPARVHALLSGHILRAS